jgi:hypothetical protein
MTVWKVSNDEPKWKIMTNGLFGYYQNGVDYLNQYAQAKGWTKVDAVSPNTIAYEVPGGYLIELSLVETTGLDLSKETYLEIENEAPSEQVETPAQS